MQLKIWGLSTGIRRDQMCVMIQNKILKWLNIQKELNEWVVSVQEDICIHALTYIDD